MSIDREATPPFGDVKYATLGISRDARAACRFLPRLSHLGTSMKNLSKGLQ
jgi:hypothetical protein